MNRTVLNLLSASSLVLSAAAQDLPKTQPNFITIIKESVKVGKSAEHAKHEAGWPAAYEKVKSPDYYLAMTSLTGQPEAWYISPWESHSKLGESMKRDLKDEDLTRELDRLSEKDADFINGVNVVQARARTDISLGTFPDLSKARFFQITIFRVRLGQQQLFEEGAKSYAAMIKRSAPDASYRMYEVIAGMPGPAYISISSVEDFAELDGRLRSEEAAWKGATPDEMSSLQRCAGEAITQSEVNRFRVDPQQSYVSKDTRDKDPGFWKGK